MPRNFLATRYVAELRCLGDEVFWRKEMVEGQILFTLSKFEMVVEGDVTRQA